MRKLAFSLIFLSLLFSLPSQELARKPVKVLTMQEWLKVEKANARMIYTDNHFSPYACAFDSTNNLYFPCYEVRSDGKDFRFDPVIMRYDTKLRANVVFRGKALAFGIVYQIGNTCAFKMATSLIFVEKEGKPFFYEVPLSELKKHGGLLTVYKNMLILTAGDESYSSLSLLVLPENVDGSIKILGPGPSVDNELLEGKNQKIGYEVDGKALWYRGYPITSEAIISNKYLALNFNPGYMDCDGNEMTENGIGNPMQGEIVKFANYGEFATYTRMLDYEGNYYFYDEKFDFYYIGRDWGFENTYLTVMKKDCPLLMHPGKNEHQVGECAVNEKITVLEKTKQAEEINNEKQAWYKVRNSQGTVGWVHGSSIKILPEEKIHIFDSPVLRSVK